MAVSTTAQAQTITWDASSGTDFNWDNILNWSGDLAKPSAASDVLFPFPAPNPATLPAPLTITLSAGELANSLVFNDAYILNGGSLTLSTGATGSGNVDIGTGISATINSTLGWGASGLTKLGAGTLILTGNNTAGGTGPLMIKGGLIAFSSEANLGAAGPVTLDGGGISFTPAAIYVPAAARVFTIGSGGGTFNTTVAGAGGKINLTTAGQLVGAGTITKTGPGDLQLSAANTGFTGAWQVNGGILEVQNVSALGSGAATNNVTVNSGELVTSGVAVSQPITLNGGATISGNSATAGTNAYTGPITITGNVTAALRQFQTTTTSTSLDLRGNLSGTGNLSIVLGSTAQTLTLGSVAGSLGRTVDQSSYSGNITVPANATVIANNQLGGGGFTLSGGTVNYKGINALSPTLGGAGVNGFYYNFGSNPNATVNPVNYAQDLLYTTPRVFTRTDSTLNIPQPGANGTYPIVPVPGFGVAAAGGINDGFMWKGLLNVVNAGSYQFSGTDDDNLVLFIDGQQIGTLGVIAAQTNIGTAVTLAAGPHAIVVKQSQGTGGGYGTVSYNGPDTANTTALVGTPFAGNAMPLTTGTLVSSLGPLTLLTSSTLDIATDATASALTTGSGATLTITSPTISGLTVTGGTTLGGGITTLRNTTAALTLNGGISESVAGSGITINGGYLTAINGTSTYTGLTAVTAGELDLNAPGGNSIPGNLTVNSPNAGGAVTNIKLLKPEQIADTAILTVTAGILDIGANNEAVGTLVLNGGTVNGSTGLLTAGTLTLSTGTLAANLASSSGLIKNSAGTLILSGAGSTYTGQTLVQAGILSVRGNKALGAAGAGNDTIVSTGAQLQIQNSVTIDDSITINGTGISGSGAIRNTGGINTLNSTLILGSDAVIESAAGAINLANTVALDGVAANATLTIQGAGDVSLGGAAALGTGSIIKNGTGTLTFTTPQTSLSKVVFNAGTLGFTGTQNFGAQSIPAGMAFRFNSNPGTGVTITSPAGTTVVGGYAVDNAFVARIAPSSAGTLALAVDDSNDLNFANAPALSLGALGNVTYSGILAPGTAGFKLGGGNGLLTVSSVLSGSSNLAINGNVLLSAANTFTGTVSLNAGGRAIITNNSNLGDAANGVILNGGTLQAASNSDNTGAILFGQLGNQVNGGARTITVGALGGTIDVPARQSAGNSFAITGANALTGSGALTKTGLGFLFELNTSDFAGNLVIAPNGNQFDIRSSGAMPNIAGATINTGSFLNVDNNGSLGSRQFPSVAIANRFNDAAAISLAGGRLMYVGRNVAFAAGTSTETFGTTTLDVGQSEILSQRTGGGGADLIISNLVRNYGGGTVRFTAGNTLGQTGDNGRTFLTQINGVAPAANQFIGGWATYNTGTDFVFYGNSTIGGAASQTNGVGFYGGTGAPAYSVLASAAAPATGNWSTGVIGNTNASLTLGGGGAGQTFVIGALRMNQGAAQTLSFTGSTGTPDMLYVESGGLLTDGAAFTRTIGATTSNFTRGILTAGKTDASTPQELFVHNNSGSAFQINSQIIDNPGNPLATVKLVKDLDGLVIIDAANNTYSGGTLVERGTLTANNTGSLGTGGVTIKNAVVNIANRGTTSGTAGVPANQAVYTLIDQSQIVLTNGTAGITSQYTLPGDRFNVGPGSNIYANSPGAGSGFNSLTRIATPASFTGGGQIYLAPDAVVKHNLTNAPDQGSGTLTIQNLGTNADLYFAPAGNNQLQTITIGAGTPWKGLSSDRGNLAWQTGTIFANSDFYLQGLLRDNGVSLLTLGGSGVTGSYSIVNNAGKPINAFVSGQVGLEDDTPVNLPGNLTFVLTAGSVFQPNRTNSLGDPVNNGGFGGIAKILVQAGGILDPGNYLALGSAANQNPPGTQNLPYPIPSPVNGSATVLAGGKFIINDASGIGSAPAGSYLLKTDSVLELGTANAFFGRGNMPFNLTGPVDTTGVINNGQFVFENGAITRINADNIYKLSQFVAPNTVIEIFGANRTLTSQINQFIPLAVGTPVIAPENITIGNGGMLTNDSVDRQVNVGRGHLIFGDGASIAATTQTFLTIQQGFEVLPGASITIGSNKLIDGVPKLGTIQLNGPNSNIIPNSASINMLAGTELVFNAVNVWPDSKSLDLPVAVTAFPSPGAQAFYPGNGTILALNIGNFIEVMGPLTGNGAVIAGAGGTAVATGFGATSDFSSGVVFKSTNGQNPGLIKIGPSKMTLTGISDSTSEFIAEQGELSVAGTGQTRFVTARSYKGATFSIDNAATAANNRLNNLSFYSPSGGTFKLIGNNSTAVTESVQTLANSTGTIFNVLQNPGYTYLNVTPGATTTTLAVNALENFQNAGIGLQRSGTWVLRSPSLGNAPLKFNETGTLIPTVTNTSNGLIQVSLPNFGNQAAFGVAAGGNIFGSAGTTVAATRGDYLGDINATGQGTGFLTEDGVTFAGTVTSGSNAVFGITSTAGLLLGTPVAGTGIPAGTTITEIVDINSVVLSQNATANGTALTFINGGLRLLTASEYSPTLRDNQNTSLNVKVAGTLSTLGDTRIQTLTLTPGSTVNVTGTVPLNSTPSRLHLNDAGLFVQAGAASTINGTANTFLQSNTGTSLFLHTQGDLNLNIPVFSDNAIVKTNAGTLNVGPGVFTAFRGSLQIDAGIVNLAANNSFVNIRQQTGFSTNENLYLNGGTLNLGGNSQFINTLNNNNPLPGMGGTLASATPATVSVNGAGVFSGTVTGAISLDKLANNTLLLTNDNPYTGTTTVRAGTLQLRDSGKLSGTQAINLTYGTLSLDNGYLSNVANRISPAAPLNSRGGTFALVGAAGQVASQTFNTVNLLAGRTDFNSNAGGAGANEITIGNLARSAGTGSTVTFNQSYGFLGTAGSNTTAIRDFISNINGAPLALTNNILPAWIIANGDHFATYNAATGLSYLSNTTDGYATYESADATTATATQNVNDGTARTFTAAKTINAWRIAPNAVLVNNFNSGAVLTLASGGLLTNNNNTVSFNQTINTAGPAAGITSGTGELDVWVNQNTSGINIPITGAIDFVKSGAGGLNLNPSYQFNNGTANSTTTGSSSVTLTTTAGLTAGMPIAGTGIPAGATISSITSGTAITISANATATGANTLLFALGNSYSGTTFVNSGTLTLNMFSANGSDLVTIPHNLVIQNATVTEANVPGQLRTDVDITFTGSGRFNAIDAAGASETIGSLTAMDNGGATGTMNILDRISSRPTSIVLISKANAITTNNTNPTTGVPFIGTFAGQIGFTAPTGATLNVNAPSTVNGLAAVGLRIDAQISTVPSGVPGGGLIKAGNGILVLNPSNVTAFTAGATTTGSNTITVANTAGLSLGQTVTGTGIPGGSFVTSIVDGTTFTINANATAVGSALTINAANISSFGNPAALTDLFNVTSGILRVDQPGALGSNFVNTTIQNGALLLGSNTASTVLTGSVKLMTGSGLGVTIQSTTFGAATTNAAIQSVMNVAGNTTFYAEDYFVPATNSLTIFVNSKLTGNGNINIVGPQISGGAGVVQIGNPIPAGTAGANDYSGTITVGTNSILVSQQALLVPNTSVTGNELGTATINLNGGRLRLRDDFSTNNSNVSNVAAAYGNNVILSADSFLDANRLTGTGVNNTITLGTLTVATGSRVLNVDSTNGYVAGFTALDGLGTLVKAGVGSISIGSYTPGYKGSLTIAGPQGNVIAPTFSSNTVPNVIFPDGVNTFQNMTVAGFFTLPAAKSFAIPGTLTVAANPGNAAGALAVNSSTSLAAGIFVNEGTVGAASSQAIITAGIFQGSGIYQTRNQELILAGNIGAGTFRVAGNDVVTVTGSSFAPTATEVQSGTLHLAPSVAATSSGPLRVFGSPAAIASETSSPVAAVTGKLLFDSVGTTVTRTGDISNSGLVQVRSGIATVNGVIAGTPIQYVPGLLEGYTTAFGGTLDSSDFRGENPGNFGVRLEPRMLQTNAVTQQALTGHTDNDTWIYTGYVKDDDGVFSFAENIDDRAAVWIDGKLALNAVNGGTSRVVSTAYSFGQAGTGVPVVGSNLGTPSQNWGAGITLAGKGDGWHLIEIRMNNGGGGSGPITGNGFNVNYGFGYKNGIAALDGADMIKPIDNGTGNLFVTPVGGAGDIQIDPGAALNVRGFNTINNVNLNSDPALGAGALNITASGNSNATSLNVNGSASSALNIAAGATISAESLVVSSGSTLLVNGSSGSGVLTAVAATLNDTSKVDVQAGSVNFTGAGAGSGGMVSVGGTGSVVVGGSIIGQLVINGGSATVSGSIERLAPGFTDGNVTLTGGTLMGNGVITGALNATGGTISPGTGSGISSGIIAVDTFTATTTNLKLDIRKTVAGLPVAGTGYDQIVVNGSDIDLGNTTLTLGIDNSVRPGDIFTIILNNGTDATTGVFAGLGAGTGSVANNGVITLPGGFQLRISYFDNASTSAFETNSALGGNDVSLQVVIPEASSWAMLAAAAGSMLGFQRLRRRRM